MTFFLAYIKFVESTSYSMRKYLICFVFASCFFAHTYGQDTISVQKQTIPELGDTVIRVDVPKELKIEKDIKPAAIFKPNPTRAVLYSAIFPGLGQIYNKKYWKLPIVYGGFIGLTYAVSWNGRYYNDYSAAYKAVMSDNPTSDENIEKWGSFIGYGKDPKAMTTEEIQRLQGPFKRKKDFYRRNRDLSIIGMVALYAVCMIDAYVDAQLFDFDISPDLSLKVEPTMLDATTFSRQSFGVQCSIKF